MSKLSAVFLAVALAFVATACGSSSDSSGGGGGGGSTAGAGSCTGTQQGVQTCVEFGSGYPAAAVQQACTASSLTYSTSACTSTGRVGRCTWTPAQGGAAMSYTASFYTGTAAELQTACQMASSTAAPTTWTPN